MQLDGGKSQLLCNVCVFDFRSIPNVHALNLFRRKTARSNCTSTSKSLEFDVGNLAGRIVHHNLQLHDVSTRWCSNKASSDVWIIFWQTSNVSRSLVVVNNLFDVSWLFKQSRADAIVA